MDRTDHLDHLEHPDKSLVDEPAQVARDAVRDELREQTRKQRRAAALYAASGAVALYAGAALALTVGLLLALGLPDWAAALITAALLGVVAYMLRNAAGPAPERAAEGRGDRVAAGVPPRPGSSAYPPVPPVAPGGMGGAPGAPRAAGAPPTGAPGGTWPPDPEAPHHRAR